MKQLRFLLAFFLMQAAFLFTAARPVAAVETQVLGMHILQPEELDQAEQLLSVDDQNQDQWHYVTVPLSLNDLKDEARWQAFFDRAKEEKVIPIVRLVTRFENGAWQIPNRRELTSYFEFLGALDWPSEQRYLIVFNEVNHAAEWGGQINPESYAQVFRFVSDWAHTENKNYVVLPAGMDLAASNGGTRADPTMEAFTYLEAVAQADPEFFSRVDVWNSHSYPNPGFSASPERTGKNSLRGFEYELAWLKQKTNRDFQVMITETGWLVNHSNIQYMESYYTYALQHIWSHPQVIAVTPFVLKGDPGPFANFSFIDRNDQPTTQYYALRGALQKRLAENAENQAAKTGG